MTILQSKFSEFLPLLQPKIFYKLPLCNLTLTCFRECSLDVFVVTSLSSAEYESTIWYLEIQVGGGKNTNAKTLIGKSLFFLALCLFVGVYTAIFGQNNSLVGVFVVIIALMMLGRDSDPSIERLLAAQNVFMAECVMLSNSMAGADRECRERFAEIVSAHDGREIDMDAMLDGMDNREFDLLMMGQDAVRAYRENRSIHVDAVVGL